MKKVKLRKEFMKEKLQNQYVLHLREGMDGWNDRVNNKKQLMNEILPIIISCSSRIECIGCNCKDKKLFSKIELIYLLIK